MMSEKGGPSGTVCTQFMRCEHGVDTLPRSVLLLSAGVVRGSRRKSGGQRPRTAAARYAIAKAAETTHEMGRMQCNLTCVGVFRC